VEGDLVEADRATLGVEPADHQRQVGFAVPAGGHVGAAVHLVNARHLVVVLAAGDEVAAHDALLVVDRPHPLMQARIHDAASGALPGVVRERRSVVAGGGHRGQLVAHQVDRAGGRRRGADDERVVARPDAELLGGAAADDAVDVELVVDLERGRRGGDVGREVPVDRTGVVAGHREGTLHALGSGAGVTDQDGADVELAALGLDGRLRRCGGDRGGGERLLCRCDGVGRCDDRDVTRSGTGAAHHRIDAEHGQTGDRQGEHAGGGDGATHDVVVLARPLSVRHWYFVGEHPGSPPCGDGRCRTWICARDCRSSQQRKHVEPTRWWMVTGTRR
jgi:hypothetical protein